MTDKQREPDYDYDDYYGDYVECDACGGEGFDDTMCECERVVDMCFCLQPTPVECNKCDGEGGWERDG